MNQEHVDVEKIEKVETGETVETAEKVETGSGTSGKELQKLKRVELLELLLEQTRENEALKHELEEKNKIIDELNVKLENRKIELENAGSIAEASLKLNGVYEAIEKAGEQYLENLQMLCEKEEYLVSKKEEEIERKCAMLLRATRERCDLMKEETKKYCEEVEASVRIQREKWL